jgi:hypothetical protein
MNASPWLWTPPTVATTKASPSTRLGGTITSQNRDAPACKVLLVLQTPIHGHEDFEAGFLREVEQVAVFLAGQTCFGYGVALVIGQAVFELPWDAFVEEDFHPSWPTSTDLASSNAAIAASLVTVGKSSMNSLRVCPPPGSPVALEKEHACRYRRTLRIQPPHERPARAVKTPNTTAIAIRAQKWRASGSTCVKTLRTQSMSLGTKNGK